MLSQDLPAEIWHQIAHHLPRCRLTVLYGVNQVFLDLALNARYGSLLLSTRGLLQKRENNPQWRLLEHVSQKHIAHRVRHVALMVSSDDRIQDDWLLAGFCFNNPRRIGHFLSVAFANLVHLQETFRRFTDLQTLSLYGNTSTSERPIVVNHLYFGIGDHLRRLRLTARHYQLEYILPLPSCTPALLELALDVKESFPADSKEWPKSMINFIKATDSTLEVLEITTSWQSWPMVQTLLEGLGELPKLKKFRMNTLLVYHTLAPSPLLDALVRFLSQNAGLLTEVKIPAAESHGRPSTDVAEGNNVVMQRFALPALKKLTISLARMPHILLYVPRFVDTLTELHMEGWAWKFVDVEKFCQSIPNRSDIPLETLSLSVLSLTPDLLQCLAENLPKVRHFMIGFVLCLSYVTSERISRQYQDMSNWSKDLEEFQIRVRAFSTERWCLQSLGLQNLSASLSWDAMEELLDALQSCLPGIEVYETWREWDSLAQGRIGDLD